MNAQSDQPPADSRRFRLWRAMAIPIAVCLAPLVIGVAIYVIRSQPLRSDLRIATSLPGGRHQPIASSLASELRQLKPRGSVIEIETGGSLENLRLLQVGLVDFGIYQAGTDTLLRDGEFRALDTHGLTDQADSADDLLAFDEFCSVGWMERAKLTDAEARQVFQRLDSDRDGFVSLAEYDATGDVRFVANVYSEVVHIIVRQDAEIESVAELAGKRVSLGLNSSGDFATSLDLLEHYDVSLAEVERFAGDKAIAKDRRQVSDDSYYEQIILAFESGELDAAIMTVGMHAQKVNELHQRLQGQVRILPVMFRQGLISKDPKYRPHTIAAGAYLGLGVDVETVAVKAQLLTRKDVDPLIVRQVAATVLASSFERANRLNELYLLESAERILFARSLPEFPVHLGAQEVYVNESFDLEQFQNWEAMYSLVASLSLAFFFLSRWVIQRRIASDERKRIEAMSEQKEALDVFLERTMDVEEQQKDENDVEALQSLLDRVTDIKLDALSELTHEDLRGDRTFSIFLMQCGSLIEKIQLKMLLVSHRIDQSVATRSADSSGAAKRTEAEPDARQE